MEHPSLQRKGRLKKMQPSMSEAQCGSFFGRQFHVVGRRVSLAARDAELCVQSLTPKATTAKVFHRSLNLHHGIPELFVRYLHPKARSISLFGSSSKFWDSPSDLGE